MYGKIVDSENGKDRKLHLIFDENTEDDRQQFEQLKMFFIMYALAEDPTMVATFRSGTILLSTILDARYFYNEKWNIVSLIPNPIISCSEIGKEQDLSMIQFSGVKFRLESKKNIRKVLTKQFSMSNIPQ